MRFTKRVGVALRKKDECPWLMVLFFGPLYFLSRGMDKHAVLCIIAAIVTGGCSWVIYPFFVTRLVRNHRIEEGFSEIV